MTGVVPNPNLPGNALKTCTFEILDRNAMFKGRFQYTFLTLFKVRSEV